MNKLLIPESKFSSFIVHWNNCFLHAVVAASSLGLKNYFRGLHLISLFFVICICGSVLIKKISFVHINNKQEIFNIFFKGKF